MRAHGPTQSSGYDTCIHTHVCSHKHTHVLAPAGPFLALGAATLILGRWPRKVPGISRLQGRLPLLLSLNSWDKGTSPRGPESSCHPWGQNDLPPLPDMPPLRPRCSQIPQGASHVGRALGAGPAGWGGALPQDGLVCCGVRGRGTLAAAHGALAPEATHHFREPVLASLVHRTQRVCPRCPGDPGQGLPLCASVSPSRQPQGLSGRMTTSGKTGGLPGLTGGIPEPRGQAWHQRAAGRGPDSPDNVDQNHELDQAEDDAHLLVAHEHHAGGVVLEEEGGQLVLHPPSHAGPAGESRALATFALECATTTSPAPGQRRAGRWGRRSGVRDQRQALAWGGRTLG